MSGSRRLSAVLALAFLLVPSFGAALDETVVTRTQRTLNLYVAAVGQRSDGTLVGLASVLTLAATSPGRGDVFVRAEPLAEVDMQGAARLAVAAAGELTGRNPRAWDYYFTISATSSIIGGPSAGGAMAAAATAVLMNWTLDPNVAMTGMINPDLSIGIVGGILYKAEAMAQAGVTTFLIPAGERIQYTTVTERRPDGVVEQRREAVDVAAHARREWGLRVVEVEDLYDVMPQFTRVALERPSTASDPTRASRYLEIMSETSATQQSNAADQLGAAESKVAAQSARMSGGDRTLAERALDNARQGVARAENATDAQRYYQASSFAFQSLVESRYALAVAEFYERGVGDARAYASSYLDAVESELDAAARDVGGGYPLTPSELGAQAAVELRLQDAASRLGEARGSLDAGQTAAALASGAFARERVGSARWWATLRDRLATFNPTANVTEDGLLALGREYGSTVALMLAYANRILSQVGGQDGRLAEAQTVFRDAQASLQQGSVAAGVYQMLQAMSLVNTAMASLGPAEALAQRLGTLRNRTAHDIEAVRAAGIEPVFAVSLFEFALYQQSTDVAEAYEGLSYARMAARVTSVASGYEPPPLRWFPIAGLHRFTPEQRLLQGAAWAWMALVALPGALALLLAGAVSWGPVVRAKR